MTRLNLTGLLDLSGLTLTKRQPTKSRRTQLGTDETFFQLMTLSGSAILKLLGMPATQAEKYRFNLVTTFRV